MKPKINFITLAVADLEKSIKFYQQAFGFEISELSDELCLFSLADDFYIAIQQQDKFKNQYSETSSTVSSAGFILSHQTQTEQEVDEIVQQAEEFGAQKVKTINEDWGYSITLKDLDNHHWEIVFIRAAQ